MKRARSNTKRGEPVRTTEGLNPQQERFCEEYMVDLNATKAATRAGYAADSAFVHGSRLLRHDKVRQRIKELAKERTEAVGLSAEYLLNRMIEIADVDPADAFDERGQLLNIKDMPENVRRAIASLELGWGKNPTKVKFWDKSKAQEHLGRYLKLFKDQLEVTDKTGIAERLARARKGRK